MNGKVFRTLSDKLLNYWDLSKGWRGVEKKIQGLMKLIAIITFTFILLLTSSCVPSAGEGGERSTSNTNINTGDPGANSGTGVGSPDVDLDDDGLENIFWFDSQLLSGDIIVDANTASPIYLRGGSVDQFLELQDALSLQKKYCIVANYPTSSPFTQLRTVATPIQFTSFGTGDRENLFRIDLNDKSNAENLCKGTVDGILEAASAYDPTDLCSGVGCPGGTLTPNGQTTNGAKITIYEVTNPTTAPSLDSLVAFDLNEKLLRINTLNNTDNTGGANSCTQAGCQSLGFDCCMEFDGQCADDGTERPNASSLAIYNQASAAVTANPLSYVDYPDVFFVCPSGTINDGNNPTDPDPSDNQTFAEILADYECQEGTTASCDPDLATVTTRIQTTCCAELGGDCSNYEYDVSTDSQTNTITDVFCVNTNTTPPPFSDQTVSVSARSVPHRFFQDDGTAVDDFDSLFNTATTQEGDSFNYLDNVNKVGAEMSSFSMNAVLGPMDVTLDQARPAHFVSVEFEKTYVIGATSGTYIPCPLCAQDSWFNVFNPHPTITSVDGLINVGHSTRRDFWEQNTTNGNYEDTKFGRACFLPPTMIPFTHRDDTAGTVQDQRLNRLATQAALYVNGYQRDWFGFNKGALIGSFDGVTWFAVGNGRRVTATTDKLYLAINGAFGDLVSNTSYNVTIIEENGNGITADADFDPDLDNSDARQNQAGSCQRNHLCETDSDCITQLGWEYMCADVSPIRTNWPTFNTSAEEQIDATPSTRSLISILVTPELGDSNRRCVYRGMGAICNPNIDVEGGEIASNKQKLAACAPNFYCADVDNSEFNDKIARDPNALFGRLYGMEADVLGRPASYVDASSTFTSAITTNLKDNMSGAMGFNAGNEGICMPGKRISEQTYRLQVENKDDNAVTRTDYISQIGSCNSDSFGTVSAALINRTHGCPILDDDGDYIFTTNTNTGVNATTGSFENHQFKYYTQNACGGSHTEQTTDINTFATIELADLSNQTSIVEATHAENACLRRAGAVCHTDLDCSPSRLHADIAQQFGLDKFGGTQAEKDYWTEFLVCGQAEEKPVFGTDRYADYDITKNRCCRPIGEDLSMATRKDIITTNTSADDTTLPITDRFPANSLRDDTDDDTLRTYSRYLPIFDLLATGSAPAVYASYTSGGAGETDAGFTLRDNLLTDDTAEHAVTTAVDQWKTYDGTANKTCCGGGWIRKFADGTNDWTKRDRLDLAVENFQCLNFRNQYFFERPLDTTASIYGNDLSRSCQEAINGGCTQVNFPRSNGFDIEAVPLENSIANFGPGASDTFDAAGGVKISFISPHTNLDDTNITQREIRGQNIDDMGNNSKGEFAPSTPTLINGGTIQQNAPYLTPSKCSQGAFSQELTLQIPAYIGAFASANSNLLDIRLAYTPDASVSSPGQTDYTETASLWDVATDGATGGPSDTTNAFTATLAAAATTDIRVTVDYANNQIQIFCQGSDTSDADFGIAWPVITFIPQGTENYRDSANANTTFNLGSRPGSETYYLTKFARMELLGIPQIHFEPIYCNSDMFELVPGIYSSYTTRESINTDASQTTISDTTIDATLNVPISGDTYVAGQDNEGKRVLRVDDFSNGAIFSEDEFMCCAPLGTTVTDGAKCCSSHSRENLDGNQECALPSGVDLNVYFNRFVSGEGRSTEDFPEGLEDDDFNSKTGEPKYRQITFDKLNNLGQLFCDNEEDDKTKLGGAFGDYFPDSSLTVNGVTRPSGTTVDDARIYGIVDSIEDEDANGDAGFTDFQNGFRWNNHLYCK